MSIEGKTCIYDYQSNLPPCISLVTKQFNNLKNLLKKKEIGDDEKTIVTALNCIKFDSNKNTINIVEESCIDCMYCAFGCPGNKIQLKSDFSLKAMCSLFEADYNDSLLNRIGNTLFKGEFIDLPSFELSHIKFQSFEEFTKVNETGNISIWGAMALKHLSKAIDPTVSLEVNMEISSRDRGGRLDICLLNGRKLFVAEAKVSFDKMVSENRYVAQLTGYDEEIKETIKNLKLNIDWYKFLLVGGSESDLLPPDHPDCTSKVGNRAQIFYRNLLKHDLYFISANALLSLGLYKIFYGSKYSIEYLSEFLFDDSHVGLLSSGVLKKTELGIQLKSFKEIGIN